MNQHIAVRRAIGIAVLATGLLVGAGPIAAFAADDPGTVEIQQPRPDAGNSRGIIQIPAGATSATVAGSVPRGDWDHWGVRAQAGQTLAVTVSSAGGNATFEVYSPSGAQLANDVFSFSGTAGSTGSYAIDVGSTGGTTTYSLTASVTGTPTPAPPPPTPTPPPGPGNQPGHSQGNIDVSSGSGTASGTVPNSGNWHHWGFRATAGQPFQVTVSGSVTFELYTPGGSQVANDVTSFTGVAGSSGFYAIDVGSTDGSAAYTINVVLGPVPPPTPPPPPPGPGNLPGHSQGNIDVSSGSGTASGTVPDSGNWHHWGFRASAGQSFTVTVSGAVTFELYTPGGSQLANDVTSFSGTASSTGFYAIDIGSTDGSAAYTITVTVA